MVGSGKPRASETSHFLVDDDESESATPPGGDDTNGDDLPAYGDADGDGTPNFLDPEPHNPDVPGGGIGGQLDKLLLVVGLIAVAWAADSGAEVLS